MITQIRIRNFRHFEDVTFTPHENTSLLCGLNGSGKSTVVELMYNLRLFLASGAPIKHLFSKKNLPQWEKDNLAKNCTVFYANAYLDNNDLPLTYHNNGPAPTLNIKIELSGNSYEYYASLLFTDALSEPFPEAEVLETLLFNDEILLKNFFGEINLKKEHNINERFKSDSTLSAIRLAAKSNKKVQEFLTYISSIFAISINPVNMDHTYQKPDNFLHYTGGNFPSWYAYHVSKSLSKIASAFDEYKAFIPGFVEMTYDATNSPVPLYVNIKLTAEKNYELPFASLSHGQKVLCILHTLIKVVPNNSTIFIDEFENYLSPSELVPLFSAMQDAYEERNVHFVLVSHHPKTLNWYKNSAFILSFSKQKPTVTIEAFDAEKNGEIYEYLDEQAGKLDEL